MTKKLLVYLILLLFLASPGLRAQESWNCRLRKAYVSQDKTGWLGLLNKRETELKSVKDNSKMFELALGYYGFAANLIRSKENAEAAIYVEKCRYFLDLLEKQAYSPAAVLSLKATMEAFGMVIDRKKGIVSGPRSLSLINAAMKADPLSPYAWAEKGNSEFYRPALFGGSFEKAAASYEKAVKLLEKSDQGDCSWYNYFTQIQLATSLTKSGKKEAAEAVWKSLLAVEPGLAWAKPK